MKSVMHVQAVGRCPSRPARKKDSMEMVENQAPADVMHSVFQLGIVVSDLEARIQAMKQAFGIEPCIQMECKYPDLYYRGEKIESWARIAKYDNFGVLLEFIQPMGDDSMWSDALKESGKDCVLHHIRFNDVPDNDALTSVFAQRGIEMLQEGGSVVHPGCKFTFYDTEKQLGFVTEVVTAVTE